MARLPRASFALMLSLLPVTATLIGVVVLAQIPSPTDLAGIALVVAGVALHQPPAAAVIRSVRGLRQLLLEESYRPAPGQVGGLLVVAGRRGVVVEGVLGALVDDTA